MHEPGIVRNSMRSHSTSSKHGGVQSKIIISLEAMKANSQRADKQSAVIRTTRHFHEDNKEETCSAMPDEHVDATNTDGNAPAALSFLRGGETPQKDKLNSQVAACRTMTSSTASGQEITTPN